jgi:hypothetical protein
MKKSVLGIGAMGMGVFGGIIAFVPADPPLTLERAVAAIAMLLGLHLAVMLVAQKDG